MVNFNIKEHTYTSVDNKKYTSVTTLIEQYKIPFDSITISEKYSKKNPERTAKEWREEWKKIGKETAEYGTKIHKQEEDLIKGDIRFKEASYIVDSNTIKSKESLKDLEGGLYPELMVWSDQHNIAGQVDLVEIKNNIVNIIDYKTYKKVNEKSFYNRRTKKWSYMLPPMQGLQDCNYNHAGLQLATYALILEELGYKIGKLVMVHIDRKGKKTPYYMPYEHFKTYVLLMLLNFKKNA